jgi:hypothetical protein
MYLDLRAGLAGAKDSKMNNTKLIELADQMNKNRKDAVKFIGLGYNVDYWIGVKEQAGLALNWLKDNGIYPSDEN